MNTTTKHIALFAAVLALGCGSDSEGGSGGSSGGGSGGTDAGLAGSGGSAGSSGGSAGSSGGSAGSSGGSAGSSGGSAGSSGGSAGTAGTAGTAGSAGGGACSPACESDRHCCSGKCANIMNDPRNCGACGTACKDGEWCNGAGKCETRPCTTTCGDASRCCGGACCATGEICCDTQGPISTGPTCTKPSDTGTCPLGCQPKCKCASPDSMIDTPDGPRRIAELAPGDKVYSMHGGKLAIVPVLRTQRIPAQNHHIVRLNFVNGARIEMSAAHPTADGRTFGDLRSGGLLDGVLLADVSVIPYAHDATYDILPQSDTGTYFASGVLVGSTMQPKLGL